MRGRELGVTHVTGNGAQSGSMNAPAAVVARAARSQGMLGAIGRTPLVALSSVVPAGAGRVLVKLEQFNPTGSYKDRMAAAIVEAAEASGQLRPGMTVVECTGGSTGTALAFVCASKGYKLKVVSSDAFATEKLRSMRAFGAELEVIPSRGGVVTPDLVPRMIERARELANEPGHFWSDQFHNPDALAGYERLGDEVIEQTGGAVDAFCACVGTAGMLMGAARALRRSAPRCKVVALEPAASPILTEGRPGAHRVEGVSVGIVPPLLDDALFDEARAIDEELGRGTARALAREEGLLVGVSSGLNVAAALQLAMELGPESTVVTVAVDTGLKYLAGDLFDVR